MTLNKRIIVTLIIKDPKNSLEVKRCWYQWFAAGSAAGMVAMKRFWLFCFSCVFTPRKFSKPGEIIVPTFFLKCLGDLQWNDVLLTNLLMSDVYFPVITHPYIFN